MFPGFTQDKVRANGVAINFRRGGEGPPVVLLHGYPQTHLMWRKIAPGLARRFCVVAPDLRGYGDSEVPPSDNEHIAYAKRTMAADVLALMQHLGYDRFAAVGHDRGGRVAYRLALDLPAAVSKLAVLDIVPTYEMWTRMDMALALQTYHWFFLAQPDGLPERLIGGDPSYYIRETIRRWSGQPDAIEEPALSEYVRLLGRPANIHAFCEDYRAGATIDHALESADRGRRKITCPVLVLWGSAGIAKETGASPVEIWREWAEDVRGQGLACGHFLPEEAPRETLAALISFL